MTSAPVPRVEVRVRPEQPRLGAPAGRAEAVEQEERDTVIEIPTHDDGLATSRPPDRYELVDEFRLESVEQLTAFRAGLTQALERLGFPVGPMGDIPSKLVLIASELATNALRHGRPPTIVRLSRNGESFLLEVTDHDPDVAPVYAGKRVRGAGGLGLHMARQLSVEVGWYATSTDKTVWAIFENTDRADG